MTVYKYDEKTCPSCDRAALVRGADRAWVCAEKRKGCGKVWPVDTAALLDQEHETWRYRKVVTLPDGRKVRVAGTPAINTKAAAQKAERDHIERLANPIRPTCSVSRCRDGLWRFVVVLVSDGRCKRERSDHGYTRSGHALRAGRNAIRRLSGVPVEMPREFSSPARGAVIEENVAVRVDAHLERMRAAYPGMPLTRTNAIRSLVLKALDIEERKAKDDERSNRDQVQAGVLKASRQTVGRRLRTREAGARH